MKEVTNSLTIKKEIEHFEKDAINWWDENGLWGILHSFNQVRVPFVVNGLIRTGKVNGEVESANLNGMKILDVGCGAGILSEALALAGADVTGIDPAEKLIEVAKDHSKLTKEKHPEIKLNYNCEFIQDHLMKYEGYYDAVIASEVVEHVPDPDSFLQYCVKASKPGGSIFITTLNKTINSFFFGWLWAEKILTILPNGTHSWSNFQKPKDLIKILNKHDCHESVIEGFTYFPIFKKFFSWGDTSVQFGLHGVRNCK
jgi:polyprenyldihydroxybenzoate methyltransferase / 3-demethylubiquinol 3-O-methyltransferase